MKTFQLTQSIKIEAETYETANSWGHKAYLYIDDVCVERDKIRYLNRTWESYQYQSILSAIIGKAYKNKLITARQKAILDVKVTTGNTHGYKKEFKTIASIAQLGGLLTKDQKESNDWKARMLKAGLENRGLIMPSDWDTLSEEVKQQRLDGVIHLLQQ